MVSCKIIQMDKDNLLP